MYRQTAYPFQVPYETDILSMQRFMYEGLGLIAMDMIGTTTAVAGFTCVPTAPATLTVNVTPGRIYSLQNLEPTVWGQVGGVGGLAVDTDADHNIVKQGQLRDTTNFSCPAPGTSGQSINYLIEVAFAENDTTNVVLPFFNASNPSSPWSGPSNSGGSLPTVRQDQATVQVKAGTAATTGTQVTPAPDSGYVGMFVVTVANGQSTITAGNITNYSPSSFIGTGLSGKVNRTGDVMTGALSATTFTPTGATAPTLGMWNPATNTIGIVGSASGATTLQVGTASTTTCEIAILGAGGNSGELVLTGSPSTFWAHAGFDDDLMLVANSSWLDIGCAGTGSGGQVNFFNEQSSGANLTFAWWNQGNTVMGIYRDGGLVLGSPTGASKGAGTLNVATGIYLNGTAFSNPDYVIEHWATGAIARFAKNAKLMDEPDYAGPLPWDDLESFMRTNLCLPRFGQNTKNDLFRGSECLLATIEELTIRCLDLNKQIRSQQKQIDELKAAA